MSLSINEICECLEQLSAALVMAADDYGVLEDQEERDSYFEEARELADSLLTRVENALLEQERDLEGKA
ncbi:MAG: hypothetical protein IPK63_16270 [Candidatus Competibacteraceae bacterium]|nr:hypothetical protein [Candidatus Competibacteraceae bacterium]